MLTSLSKLKEANSIAFRIWRSDSHNSNLAAPYGFLIWNLNFTVYGYDLWIPHFFGLDSRRESFCVNLGPPRDFFRATHNKATHFSDVRTNSWALVYSIQIKQALPPFPAFFLVQENRRFSGLLRNTIEVSLRKFHERAYLYPADDRKWKIYRRTWRLPIFSLLSRHFPTFFWTLGYPYFLQSNIKLSRHRQSILMCKKVSLTKKKDRILFFFSLFVVILGFSHLCESRGSHISVSRLSSFAGGTVNQKWHLVHSPSFPKLAFWVERPSVWLEYWSSGEGGPSTSSYCTSKSRFTPNAHSLNF